MKKNLTKWLIVFASLFVTGAIMTLLGIQLPGSKPRKKQDYAFQNKKDPNLSADFNKKSIEDKLKEITKGECDYNTINSNRSLGVKLKASYPCDWIENKEILAEKPNMLCQYVKEFLNVVYAFSISINEVKAKLTSEKIEEIRSAEFLKKSLLDPSNYISSNPIEINGVKGSELISIRALKKEGWFLSTYAVSLYKDNKLIYIMYAVSAEGKGKTIEVFESQKRKFINYVSNIRVD